MPYKSEAQRRKFQEMQKEGKISKEVVDAFETESKGIALPERVKPKAKKAPVNKVWMAKVIK